MKRMHKLESIRFKTKDKEQILLQKLAVLTISLISTQTLLIQIKILINRKSIVECFYLKTKILVIL